MYSITYHKGSTKDELVVQRCYELISTVRQGWVYRLAVKSISLHDLGQSHFSSRIYETC